ncbi:MULTISPECIES: HEPN domain-containing protein [Clostridium]|uniref:HEPN domain-containing protein n=1 Tax=Clostridium TaxID=1485 RepID=UPI0020798BB1|nr:MULTISPECIES: HEPN domain-containing protein [Clostridium]
MVNKDMFYFADIDERFINKTKNLEGLEDGVLVHCQQCIEKNIKGIILKKVWNCQ